MSFKRFLFIFLVALILAFVAFAFSSYNENNLLLQRANQLLNIAKVKLVEPVDLDSNLDVDQQMTEEESVNVVAPTVSAIPTRVPTPVDPYANDPDLKDAEWGEAVQVSETGWRMKVGFDQTMSTPTEAFQALNLYRYTKGKSNLTWDDRLANYALERATYICQNGSDAHEGFKKYVKEEEGYKNLGFYWLGENMSTHMRFTGTHLIEWMYASDPYHDGNQLGDWSHVGVGIYEDCSALIFGNKMI